MNFGRRRMRTPGIVATTRAARRLPSPELTSKASGPRADGETSKTRTSPFSADRERPLRRRDDLLDARQVFHLQSEQRDMGVVAGDTLDRGQQFVQAFLGHARGDLAAEA